MVLRPARIIATPRAMPPPAGGASSAAVFSVISLSSFIAFIASLVRIEASRCRFVGQRRVLPFRRAFCHKRRRAISTDAVGNLVHKPRRAPLRRGKPRLLSLCPKSRLLYE